MRTTGVTIEALAEMTESRSCGSGECQWLSSSADSRERLDALPQAARAELLHVLILPDFERADRIGEFWGYPKSRAFAELLID